MIYRTIVATCSVIFCLSACNTLEPNKTESNYPAYPNAYSSEVKHISSDPYNENNNVNKPAYLLRHTEDKRGENLFPYKQAATGKRTFFLP